jgi:hypothetical protein
MEHTIEITIAPDGTITAVVQGVEGPVCGDLSKWLDEVGRVETDEPTTDYYLSGSASTGLKVSL